MASAVFLVREKGCFLIGKNSKRLNQNLEKVSRRQDRLLRENNNAVETLDGTEPPLIVKSFCHTDQTPI